MSLAEHDGVSRIREEMDLDALDRIRRGTKKINISHGPLHKAIEQAKQILFHHQPQSEHTQTAATIITVNYDHYSHHSPKTDSPDSSEG